METTIHIDQKAPKPHKHLDSLKRAYSKFFKLQLKFFGVEKLSQLSSAGKRLLFERIKKEWPTEKARIIEREERRIRHAKEIAELEQKYGGDESEEDYDDDDYEESEDDIDEESDDE